VGVAKGPGAVWRSKRGIFFTLMSVILVTLMILSISVIPKPRFSSDAERVALRVETMNDFVIDLDEDLERAAYIISYATLLRIDGAVVENGSYVHDLPRAFSAAFINGTLDSSDAGISLTLNDSFQDYTRRIAEQATSLGIQSSVTIEKVDISQQDPWSVSVRVSMTLNVTDQEGTARWIQQKNISSIISIIGFEDPVYHLKSLGRVTKTIAKSPLETYVTGGVTDDLKRFINASWYRNSTSAPTFLMRLSGNFSANPEGIESMVYLQEFIQQGLSIQERSDIDHLYFSNITHTAQKVTNVTDTPGWEWFRLDNDTAVRYGADQLLQ